MSFLGSNILQNLFILTKAGIICILPESPDNSSLVVFPSRCQRQTENETLEHLHIAFKIFSNCFLISFQIAFENLFKLLLKIFSTLLLKNLFKLLLKIFSDCFWKSFQIAFKNLFKIAFKNLFKLLLKIFSNCFWKSSQIAFENLFKSPAFIPFKEHYNIAKEAWNDQRNKLNIHNFSILCCLCREGNENGNTGNKLSETPSPTVCRGIFYSFMF